MDQGSEITLVHMSGVHGIEGYLGSLVQDKILSTIEHGFRDHRCNVIFVHAVNPFGMSWYRRVNANNVDLNRNGIIPSQLPSNPHFPQFKDILKSSSRKELAQRLPTVIKAIYRAGFAQSSQAIAGGQWQFPDSIFFGGQEIQPEIHHLPETLMNLAPKTKKFFVIDVHSGLGPHGYDSLLVSEASQLDFFRRTTDEAGKSSHVVDCSPTAKGNLYYSHETFENLLRRELKNQEVFYVTQEFGTRFVLPILISLILENTVYAKDPRNALRPELLLESFFPDSETWRKTCRRRGLQRFSQLLAQATTA